MSRAVYRFRLAAVCLALTAVVFVQEPGRVAADTKLDLTVDPVGLMSRALHLWDSSGFFGQVQNQAYGYLWPVGPFFAVLDFAEVGPWVSQRIWWSVLLVTGFLGFVRVSRQMGVSSAGARVVAGLGYVLSVRILSGLTANSVEMWPMALAPWVLLPLVLGSRGGSPRRYAALSGAAFGLAGAVNAVASAAILPVGAMFLVTRQRGRRRTVLTAWWVACVALVSVWWVVPLLLLGRYSPPFLDWIESAAVTTSHTDPTSIVRGASHWVPYFADPAGPIWPAGWYLVASHVAVAATGALAVLGFAGLLRRRTPERTFLVLTLCLGLVLVGLGHVSGSGLGAIAGHQVQDLLDGPLAPLRNVHKFQPLVTMPLMVGLAHAIQAAQARTHPTARRLRSRQVNAGRARVAVPVATMVAAGLIALGAVPAWQGGLVGGRSHLAIPGYWREAASWLTNHDDGRALVIPAASFGVYMWGRTQDEPLQPLATGAWAVRDVVPLSSAGNIRLLDEVERYLSSGTGTAGLTEALARSGVRYLVVRNDLDFRATQATPPVLIHQALDQSPGISLAATFGPMLRPFQSEDRLVDSGLWAPYPAVEIFRVAPDARTLAGRVALRDASTVTRFGGAAEALPDLLESGLVADGPAIAEGDPIPDGVIVSGVVTDTYRRSEANFGSTRNQYSNTLAPDDPYEARRRVHDYVTGSAGPRFSSARLLGVSQVSASSSGSNPFAFRGRSSGAQPWAALDGDPRTAWLSGEFQPGVGQWWRVALDAPTRLQSVSVQVVRDLRVGVPPRLVRVTTDRGYQDFPVAPTGEPQTLRLKAPVTTTQLRLELRGVTDGSSGQGFGLAEVAIPDVSAARPVVIAEADASGGSALAARSWDRESCVATAQARVCTPELALPGEERAGIDRIVSVPTTGSYRVLTRLRPRPGAALDAYLAAPRGTVSVHASSQATQDPAGRAQAGADRDPRTTWIASASDAHPTLTLRLPTPQSITGLLLQTSSAAPASKPLAITVRMGSTVVEVFPDTRGRVRLPPTVTDEIQLGFGAVSPVRSIDSNTGATRPLPVGVSEVRLLGGPDLRMDVDPSSAINIPCGHGPSVRVDGTDQTLTDVSATVGGVLDGALASGASCRGRLELPAGTHRIQVYPSAEWLVERVYLIPEPNTPIKVTDVVSTPTIKQWDEVDRKIGVEADERPRLLETTENWNAGWKAHLGGIALQPFRVDGWRQAFFLPAGVGGEVQLRYDPDRRYLLSLMIGFLCAISVLGLAGFRDRSPRPPASGPAGFPRVLLVVPLATSLLVGGPFGLAAAAAVAGLAVTRWRVAMRAGIFGLVVAMALQAARPWPDSVNSGLSYDLVLIMGPAMGLGALAARRRRARPPDVDPDAPIAEPVARPSTSWHSR